MTLRHLGDSPVVVFDAKICGEISCDVASRLLKENTTDTLGMCVQGFSFAPKDSINRMARFHQASGNVVKVSYIHQTQFAVKGSNVKKF
jgi:hypothetical protein